MKLGISGQLTKAFIRSPLTPLILLASFAVGLLALMVIPREEEPQISVPMVDIMVRADGLKATDAVELITEPLEAIIRSVDAVEHVYSLSEDDQVLVTARFEVGTSPDAAILRIHERIRADMDRMPLGIPEPLIIGRGINDVAIVALTLSPRADVAGHWDDHALHAIAEELRASIMSVQDVGLSYIVGGRADQIRIEPDPERLSQYGVTLQQLVGRIAEANRSFPAGQVSAMDRTLSVAAGQTLQGSQDIGLLLLTTRDGRPVYVRDVADVIVGAEPSEARAWMLTREDHHDSWEGLPAVTLALATVSIVLLVTFVIGWREGVVVFVLIPTTILLTLFASNLMGYTINRVSLFALIFSIGILVDDAIVVIENIARHWAMKDGRDKITAAIEAVAEVGNPTIVATLTVVAALLPMLFVSGLMGPYMAPIPLTFIGIILGHWMFDAAFTATSMIGLIALAGIIVRNSILLVDLIRHGAEAGEPLRETLLRAGAIRFKPILLTAIAAMIGASVILGDPIFQGLAISLLFGLASSTLLTVLVIPAIYVIFKDGDQPYTPKLPEPLDRDERIPS